MNTALRKQKQHYFNTITYRKKIAKHFWELIIVFTVKTSSSNAKDDGSSGPVDLSYSGSG